MGYANPGLIRAPITPSGGRTMSVSQKTVSVSDFLGVVFMQIYDGEPERADHVNLGLFGGTIGTLSGLWEVWRVRGEGRMNKILGIVAR